MKRKPLPMIADCTDCGACCMHMRTPPHIVKIENAQQAQAGQAPYVFASWGGQSQDDFDWLMSAPEEARRIFLAEIFKTLAERPDDSPCSWLDLETKQCRFHAHRPGICREFPVGGESCRDARVRRGVDKQAKFTLRRGKVVKA